MSQALQYHGRAIATGFSSVTFRQGADCGTLVSESEPDGSEEGLTLPQRLGIGVALIVLLIGGAAALGGP